MDEFAISSFRLELRLDEHATNAVKTIWERLNAAGVPSFADYSHERHQPHVALAAISAPPDDSVLRRLARLSSVLPKSLSFSYLGMNLATNEILGELFIGVAVDRALLSSYGEAHEVLKRENHLPGYKLGEWVPRCALSDRLTSAEEISRALVVLEAEFEPFSSPVASVCFVEDLTGMEIPIF